MKNLLFLVLISLLSCVQDNPKITILNNSSINYDSIKVYSSPTIPTIFRNLGSKETTDGLILFDKNIKSDGAYTIQIFDKGIIVQQKYFGYYTNGASLNREIKVTIEPDTLQFYYY